MRGLHPTIDRFGIRPFKEAFWSRPGCAAHAGNSFIHRSGIDIGVYAPISHGACFETGVAIPAA
jgi:hypothetical protein